MNLNKTAWVKAGPVHGWVRVSVVKFIGISESPHGDMMSFEYEGESFTSYIYFGAVAGRLNLPHSV